MDRCRHDVGRPGNAGFDCPGSFCRRRTGFERPERGGLHPIMVFARSPGPAPPDAGQTFPGALRLVQNEARPRCRGRLRPTEPLLDDLLTAEWFLQIRDAANGSPEYALAIRLDASRAKLWQDNLQNLLEAWTGLPGQKTANGWTLKKHLPPDLIRFVRAGDWVVFGMGQDALPVNDELVRQVTSEKRPGPVEKNAWLAVDVNWPRLARWFPAINPFELPETQLQLVGRDRVLRLDGKLVFPQPLALTLDKWRIPMDTIHDPVISFTAMRGIAPWLQKQSWAQPYEIHRCPIRRLSGRWPRCRFRRLWALPVPDAKQALKEIEQKLSVNTDGDSHLPRRLTMVITNNQISWNGLPFVEPGLQAVHESAGDFLLGAVVSQQSQNQTPAAGIICATQPAQSGLLRLGDHRGAAETVAVFGTTGVDGYQPSTARSAVRGRPMAGRRRADARQYHDRGHSNRAQRIEFQAQRARWLDGNRTHGSRELAGSAQFPRLRFAFVSSPAPAEKSVPPATTGCAAARGVALISCSNSASILITSPPSVRRVIAAADLASPTRWKPRDFCEAAGAHGITAHLREDRRHIQDRDVWKLRETVKTRLNLEMALVPEIIAIALKLKPDIVCIVPERRLEVTTEGGLDVVGERSGHRPTRAKK